MILIILDCIKFKLFVMLRCHMRSSFSISVLYHAYVYLEFLILACTIYILAPPDRAARPSITAQLKEAARRAEPPKEPDKAKHNKSHEDR